jgi:excinuclease ABC subunit C
LARAHRVAVVAFFKIRDNKLFAREVYRLSVDPLSRDSEIVAAFIRSTYLHQSFFPDEIVVPLDPDDSATLRKWFTSRGKTVNFALGRYEDKRALADWARRSAELELGISAGARPLPQSLLELAGALKLKSPPRWIEAFDVSNILGSAAVGASVSFKDGKPDKSRYRRFRIKRTRGQNDFAMIKEIVSRRLQQMDKERPDLLLIDGGKGQLSAARAGLDAVNLDLPVLAFAKRTDQLFFQDGRVITIPVASPALYLLKRIRNESHRFAITYHRKVRGRETRSSVLDRIPGIGPAKKIELLRYFGSVERLRAASKEEISKVKGVRKIIAERIYEALHT